ncbi:TolC family protein [Marinilabiliaceae bacterium ANBcel2]|nr:TolC family protein [Marinilabiliaceae bacterium ANBcel2]
MLTNNKSIVCRNMIIKYFNNKILGVLTVFLFFISSHLTGEQYEPFSLTLSEIIQESFENNPALQIEHNREEMVSNNHTYEPFMPSITASGRTESSRTETTRRRDIGGEELEDTFTDVKSETLGGGVNLSWRIFDGLGMFAAYDRTKLNLSIRELETRKAVENLVIDISDYYYRIIVQNKRVEAAREALKLSKERFSIIEEKVELGAASGLELQHASLDQNTDSSNVVRQQQILDNYYIRLNRLMNQSFDCRDYINDSIEVGEPLHIDDLELLTVENNSDIRAALKGIDLSKTELRLARSERFPVLDFVTGYTYNRSESPAGVMTFNKSHGHNYGFQASFNVFDGMRVNRLIDNAKIEKHNRELGLENIKLEVMEEVHTMYNLYLNNLMMIEFEQNNLTVSINNLEIALERYELGNLSGVEFREFQVNYLESVDRLLDAQYQSKVLELSLLVISGQMDEFLSRIN